MTKHLTPRQKREFLPKLIKFYGTFACFYCKVELNPNSFVYDHLNNEPSDNRIENVVMACQSCNNKKPHNSDMQILAKEQLVKNEKSNFMGEREVVDTAEYVSPEMKANKDNSEIAEQYISERIAVDGFVFFNDALNSIVYTCKKTTKSGSHQAVRNYINALTSSIAPFEFATDKNKAKIIIRRQGR